MTFIKTMIAGLIGFTLTYFAGAFLETVPSFAVCLLVGWLCAFLFFAASTLGDPRWSTFWKGFGLALLAVLLLGSIKDREAD